MSPRPWSRRLSLSLIAVTVIMAAALGTGTWMSYASAKRAAEVMAVGEGSMLFGSMIDALPRWERPTDEALQAIVDQESDNGLRHVAIYGRDGKAVAQAGAHRYQGSPLDVVPRDAERPTVKVGDRRLMVIRPGGRRSRRPKSAQRQARRPDSRRRRPPRGAFVLEFEAVEANALLRQTRVTLGLGAGATLTFLAMAGLFFRVLRNRDAIVEQMERDRRLASLGEMSAVLAHEIRNPLASLKGHAQLLHERLPEDSREYKKASRVVSEAERLEKLTGSLLDFVKAGEIERTPHDPMQVIFRAVSTFGDDAVDVRGVDMPDAWSFDAERIMQVVDNLVSNAIQASTNAERRPELTITQEGKSLVVTCRDHGEGIPPEELPHIFEPFRTTRTQGTGLGLAVARRIVTQHGGTIEARNHDEGGAEFRFTIPA